MIKKIRIEQLLPWFIGFVFVICYVLPWVLSGENGFVRIHDTLDSNLVWYKILNEHKLWFVPNLTYVGPIFQNGVPRVSYPGELSLVTLLFYLFKPYWAYVVNQFILRLLAFSGSYIFLRYILPFENKKNIFIVTGVSLCYATLPHWAFGGGSVACIPWVFYAFVRTWRGYLGITEIFILIAYPFYSHIVLTGMFLIGFIWLLIPIAWFLKKQIRPVFFAAIITTITHIITNYRLFHFLFFDKLVSQREDFVRSHNSLSDSWSNTLQVFQHGEWAVTLHGSVIFYTVLIVILLSILYRIIFYCIEFYKNKSKNKTKIKNDNFALESIVAVCFGISLFCGFWDWDPITTFRESIPILIQVNFTRFTFFLPFLWMIAFAISLTKIVEKIKFISFMLILGLLFLQFTFQLRNHEYKAEEYQTGITFAQFFSESLFEEIKLSIPEDQSNYVTASIGIHPSIAQYNGFRTADAFLGLYSKKYKSKFRKAVFKEFSRRNSLINYFDRWGCMAYFFTSEMRCPRDGAVCKKDKIISPIHVEFNISAMKDLGVKYIFSVPIIANASDLGLKFIDTYENNESAWRISLYRLPN